MRANLFLFLLMVLTLSACAATPSFPTVFQAIQKNPDYKFEVVREFEVGSGIRGWVISDNGEEAIAYTTADGKIMFMGNLVNDSLHKLSADHRSRYLATGDHKTSLHAAKDMAWFSSHPADTEAPVVYVFTDTHCSYCADLWHQTQILSEQVAFRYLPVGILGPDSLAAGASLLETEQPMEELARYYSSSPPSPTETTSGSSMAIQSVTRNTAFMQSIGAKGTPALLFMDKSGVAILREGIITAVELEELLGLQQ